MYKGIKYYHVNIIEKYIIKTYFLHYTVNVVQNLVEVFLLS